MDQVVRISSMVLEARRDCWGGAGPDVEVVGAAAVDVLKRLGAAALGWVVVAAGAVVELAVVLDTGA